MILPAVGSRAWRLEHLRVTLSRSVTFQKLVGAFSPEQALGKVFDDVALDVSIEDPDFDSLFPRGVIRHEGPQMAVKNGMESYLGSGGMGIYVQYLQFSDAQLSEWYRVAKQIGYTVNFGVKLSEKVNYDSCPFPSDCFMEEIGPSIEIQVEDFDQIASFDSVTQITQFSAFLRRRAEGSTYCADNASKHVKFGFANGTVVSQARRASETKHGNASLIVRGVSLTKATGQAVAAPS